MPLAEVLIALGYLSLGLGLTAKGLQQARRTGGQGSPAVPGVQGTGRLALGYGSVFQPRLAGPVGPTGTVDWGQKFPISLAKSLSPTLQRSAKVKIKSAQGLEARVQTIKELINKGSQDPAVRNVAIAVLSKRNPKKLGGWQVGEKDWKGEAEALFAFVRRNVRYTRDHAKMDTFVHPARTLFETASGSGGGGDCLPVGTLLLTEGHKLVPIEMLQPGMRIWGLDDWTTVQRVWAKDVLPTFGVRLNNGSTFHATADHHVYVKSCPVHGPLCKTLTDGWMNCKRLGRARLPPGREFTLARVEVSDLTPGMVLAQPERIAFGTETMDPDRAWVEGLYLADGWAKSTDLVAGGESHTTFYISGKDGHPKEAQKREVVTICDRLGLKTRWHERYVAINDKVWAERMATMGDQARDKHALSIDLDEGAALALLRGVNADADVRDSVFTTTSRLLALQVRLLWKMAGVSCGEAYIEDHGGLGENPIWRLTPRLGTSRANKTLRVVEVSEDPIDLPCWDITTDSGFVYLPTADVTVSNCDDYTITLGALLMSVGHGVKIRVGAIRNDPGEASPPWNHIWVCSVLPIGGAVAGSGKGKLLPLDASVDKPPGWEAPKDRIARMKEYEV